MSSLAAFFAATTIALLVLLFVHAYLDIESDAMAWGLLAPATGLLAMVAGIFGANLKNATEASRGRAKCSTCVGASGCPGCCLCCCYDCTYTSCCSAPTCLVMVPSLDAAGSDQTARSSWDFSHHPDHPAFDQDVFRIGSRRLCIGCFTGIPLFTVTLLVAPWFQVLIPWQVLVAGGLVLASVQGISAAGLARAKWSKIFVKSCLGVGLAFNVAGIALSPWPVPIQWSIMLALLLGVQLSAMPRVRRLRAFEKMHRRCRPAWISIDRLHTQGGT